MTAIATKAHVLVTGGTGLVGAPIVDRLLAEGHCVTVLSRRSQPVTRPNLSWVRTSGAGWEHGSWKTIRPVDCVVHAAAEVHDDATPEASGKIHRSNISLTEDLFTWSCQAGVERIIFLSSFSLLSRPLVTPITEAHTSGPTTAYACSKFWGEQLLERYASAGRCVSVILRVSSPVPASYERLHDTVLKKWILCARQGQPLRVFGTGSRSQDFVSCDDIACAVVKCVQAPLVSGTYNIAGGKPLSMRETAETIAAIRGTAITFEGIDPNEGQSWEISIAKAASAFGYTPKCVGKSAVARVAGSAL